VVERAASVVISATGLPAKALRLLKLALAQICHAVPVHGFETPICAYAAIGIELICSARTWAGVW
jgi:hypothetical protein